MLFILNHRYLVMVWTVELCINISFCMFIENSATRHTGGEKNKFGISEEEILRRRKLIEPHLLNIVEKQKDWIETSHFSFGEIPSKDYENPVSKEYPVNDNPLKVEHEHLKVETNRFESLQLDLDSARQGISFIASKVINDFSISLEEHKSVEDFLPEVGNLEKTVETNHVNSKNYNPEISSYDFNENKNIVPCNAFKINREEGTFKLKIIDSIPLELTEVEKDHSAMNSEDNKNILPSDIEKFEGIDSIDKFPFSSDEILSEYKTKSIPVVKPTETIKERTESHETSVRIVKYEISSNDKVEVIDSESDIEFSKKSKKISQSVSEITNIESTIFDAGETETSKVEKFYHDVEKYKTMSDSKLTSSEDMLVNDNIKNEKSKKTSYSIPKSTEEKSVNKEFEENDGAVSKEKLHSISDERLQKQKLLESYISSLNEGRKNWKETYHFSYTDSEEIGKSLNNDFNSDKYSCGEHTENISLKPVQIQERLYFIRWIKKVLNKIDYPYVENINMNFLLTTDVLNDLKKLSGKFDINVVDKLISDLISNATVHSSYKLSDFYNSYASVGFYITVSVILLVLSYFLILYYRIFRIMFVILVFLVWHGFKMYQEKVAEKHATVSGSSPEYCVSILNKESGIFAQFKEFMRYSTYDVHCKKYFEAIMIDPISELSLSLVISDCISSTFFQVLRPMGRALNTLVKDLFTDLSFLQTFYLIALLILLLFFSIVCILIYNKYKLNFPFFMGSIEPSTLVGSRVEDLTIKSNVKETPLTLKVSKKYNKLIACNTRKFDRSMLHKTDFQLKILKASIRRYSF